MDEELDRQIKFDPVPPLQFIYEKISVVAEVEEEIMTESGERKKVKEKRTILKQCSGKFEPKTVTAILGPSGSGKTTMLNLLSGRLLSKNLQMRGRVIINGKQVQDMGDYKGVVGYVMQQDLMLPTFTPRECFRFITDMRLPHKTSEEKDHIVQAMIESLGLTKCSETFVGGDLIRGLSGGERKRTSVGIQLLVNPSLIFLDEPTTGLDSTTALNLIKFLNRLANSGRTIVTTIHQPSSQIFREFDGVLLMLDGNIVYQNRARDSMAYFQKLGLPAPLHTNPMDHYMKLMNKQGIMLQFLEKGGQISQDEVTQKFRDRVKLLVASYKENQKPHEPTVFAALQDHGQMATWFTQFKLIFMRSMINQLRNPMGLRSKMFQMLFFAIVTIILFEKQAKSLDSYIQNMMGILFFICMNVCFAGTFGSVTIFGQERPVFIRERLSNTYDCTSYFFGRSVAYLPIQLFLPVLLVSVSYFALHLDNSGNVFMISIAACWLATWMSSAYGLLLSTAFSNPQVAIGIIPVLIIPLMLVGGLYAPLQNVPDFYKIFQYISMFKYNYQALVYAQFHDKTEGFTVTLGGTEYHYTGDIMAKGRQLYVQEPFWLTMFLMGIIGLAIRILSLIALKIVSNPQSTKLLPPQIMIVQAKPQKILVKSNTPKSTPHSSQKGQTPIKQSGESSLIVLN